MDTHRYSGPAAKAAPAASPVSEPAEINAPDVHFVVPCTSIRLPWRLGQCDLKGAGRDRGRPSLCPFMLQGASGSARESSAIPALLLQLHPARVSPYSRVPRSLTGQKVWTGITTTNTSRALCCFAGKTGGLGNHKLCLNKPCTDLHNHLHAFILIKIKYRYNVSVLKIRASFLTFTVF